MEQVGMICSAWDRVSLRGPLWLPVLAGVVAVVYVWPATGRGTSRATRLSTTRVEEQAQR